jgi:CBS domain-containing protein
MAQNIREVMTTEPVTMPEHATAAEAARAMRDSGIGDVIVLDETQSARGIVTDRDIAVRLVAEGKDPSATAVGEICSSGLHTLTPDNSVEDAIKLMSDQAVRRVVIVDADKPVGVVSLGDLAVTRDPDSALADISAAPPNE